MKKIILSALALVLVGASCVDLNAQEKSKEQLKAEAAAQKALKKEFDANLKTAKKNIVEGAVNVAAARDAIKAAAQSPLAEGNADFYLTAGDVEKSISQTYLQGAPDYNAYTAAAEAAFDYYNKAYEAAAGGKAPKVVTAAQEGALLLYRQSNGLTLFGSVYYQAQEWQKSFDAFQKAKTAHLTPVMSSQKANPIADLAISQNSADSSLVDLGFNCVYVAQNFLQDTTAAINEMLDLKTKNLNHDQLNQVLSQLALCYYGREDSVAFEATLKEGVEKLPEESWYINNLINVYIQRNDLESAGKLVDQAIAANPENDVLLNTKGMMLEEQGKIEDALACYEKALAVNPTSVAVNVSLGRYYSNRAVAIEDELFKQKKFNDVDRQTKPLYEKSLPYYEAAYAFDTEHADKSIAVALRGLYGKQIAIKGKSSAEGKEYLEKYNEVSLAYGFAPAE